MPGFENDEQVVNALVEAARADGYDTSLDATVAAEANRDEDAPEQAATPAPEGEAEVEEQPEEDSFTHLDPSKLPAEARPFYDSMLADYRRKTQKLAERSRVYDALEQYGGPEVAAEALDWVASLQDPNNAVQFHRELTKALQDRGYSLSEAQEEATRVVEGAQREAEDEFEFGAERDPRVDALQQKLDELDAWRSEQERETFGMRLAAHYDRQEAEVLGRHEFKNDEERDNYLADVYNMSFAFGGNLIEADDYIQDIKSRALADYMASKTSASPGISGVPATAPADIPKTVTDLNDPELEKSVMQFLAERAAAES